MFKKKFKNIKTKLSNKFLSSIILGKFGLKAVSRGIITPKQLETVRRTIARSTKRTSKIIIRIFFYQAYTQKSLSSRMGKGTGSIKGWIAYIKKGMILIELAHIDQMLAYNVLTSIYSKLPFKTKFVSRSKILI